MTISAFDELRVLFPRQKSTNPVEAFLRQYQGKDRAGRKHKVKLQIKFGREFIEREIDVRPRQEARLFQGSEFGESIVSVYNKDYWLIALWAQMSRNAEKSHLGRELVRAFVKHGIILTGEELLQAGRVIDSDYVRNDNLSNRVEFYRDVFDWTGIFGCIRERARKKIVERLKRGNAGLLGHELKHLKWDRLSGSLPEINKILDYSNLPQVAVDAKKARASLGGLLQYVWISGSFLVGSGKIRKHLRAFLATKA